MFKKSIGVALGFSISSFSFAGSMGAICIPGNVVVPCETKGWELGIEALYLEPVFGTSKAYKQALTASGDILGINNPWDWGYQLEGAYFFNTGNDIRMDWLHFEGGLNQSNLSGNIILPTGDISLNQALSLNGQDRLDKVNLLMGQQADFGLIDRMHFFGGLQYAHVQVNTTNYFNTIVAPYSSVSQFDNTDFKGLGPILGIDYAFDISSSLSLTAHGAGSILYGTSRYSNGFVGAPVGLVWTSVYAKTNVMIPSLDAKLGMNYAYRLAQGSLNLEGGYQAINYFNALQTQGLQGLTGPILASDYGLYGPYFGLKYIGNA